MRHGVSLRVHDGKVRRLLAFTPRDDVRSELSAGHRVIEIDPFAERFENSFDVSFFRSTRHYIHRKTWSHNAETEFYLALVSAKNRSTIAR